MIVGFNIEMIHNMLKFYMLLLIMLNLGCGLSDMTGVFDTEKDALQAENPESSDAEPGDDTDKEIEIEDPVTGEFMKFQIDYTVKILELMQYYYFYEFKDADTTFTYHRVMELFYAYRNKVYISLLSGKLLELDYFVEEAKSGSISDEDKNRINQIIQDLYNVDNECSELIPEICVLVLG